MRLWHRRGRCDRHPEYPTSHVASNESPFEGDAPADGESDWSLAPSRALCLHLVHSLKQNSSLPRRIRESS
eukprot:3518995-Pleurochrysis_carterae.AAC.1